MVLSIPIAAQLGPAYGQTASVALTPAPSVEPSLPPTPRPTPTPRPGPVERKGGPLIFRLSGAVSLGRTSTSSSYGEGAGFFATPTPTPNAGTNNLFPFQGSSTDSTMTEIGAGMAAELSRRTATTYTDLKVPIGITGTGRSAISLSSLLYSTPKYSLGYGPQPLNALGQLQMGSTLRGFQVITPERYGQMTYYQGPTLGADGEPLNIYGALSQQVHGRSFYELGFIYGAGDETGVAKTVIFGAATARGNIAVQNEGAWQQRSHGDGSSHGIADQLRIDDNAKNAGCSTTVRSIPDQFLVFGSGEIDGDKYADLGCHGVKIPVYADISYEKTGDPAGGINVQRLASFGYSPAFRFGGASINAEHQDTSTTTGTLTSNGVNTTFQTNFLGTSAVIGTQLQRQNDEGQLNDTRSLLGSLHRSFGKFNVGVTGQVQVQTESGFVDGSLLQATPLPVASPVTGVQRGLSFNVSRSWRKTTVQLGESITRSVTASSNAIQKTPLINLTRQLSSSISVTTSLGYQILNDRLNPALNGRTRIFTISMSAPFSYGNGIVTGRADPHLPATIVGRVVLAPNTTSGGAALNLGTLGGSGGVGNVMVTLDGTSVVRTDLTGSFQFSFVPAGVHQLSISTATIPAGFTANMPVQSITLKGGQQADVSFAVSTLGGILGHVYSSLDGAPVPLVGVKLQVDGAGQYAQTDSNGAYGFGGLTPGEHEVTVIANSVPATADFLPEDLKHKIAVSDGRYASLDFNAQVLGSISGEIIFAKDMAPDYDGGVPNAYVVAEPGEHASIDDSDGTFVIDNLPAGDYTISVDPETIPSMLGASPDSITVHLAPGEHYQGLHFSVGRFEKKVVFTLLSGAPPPAQMTVRLSETRLPLRGTTAVAINAPPSAKGVSVGFLGKQTPLAFDKGSAKWVGEIEVPPGTAAGQYQVTGSAAGPAKVASASLAVDPTLPLAIVQYAPKRVTLPQNVTVRVRFLVDVHAGEHITWSDGTDTILGKPVSGRVFTFTKRLTLLPLHGLLLTPAGNLPIELL